MVFQNSHVLENLFFKFSLNFFSWIYNTLEDLRNFILSVICVWSILGFSKSTFSIYSFGNLIFRISVFFRFLFVVFRIQCHLYRYEILCKIILCIGTKCSILIPLQTKYFQKPKNHIIKIRLTCCQRVFKFANL